MYIPVYNLLSLHNVIAMCVFWVENLVLDKQLEKSSLKKTVSSALSIPMLLLFFVYG